VIGGVRTTTQDRRSRPLSATLHTLLSVRPLVSGQPRWSSSLGCVAERGYVALGDYLQPIVSGLCRNTKQFFDFICRKARIVEECNRQLLAFASVSLRSCWRNCSGSTPSNFVPFRVILLLRAQPSKWLLSAVDGRNIVLDKEALARRCRASAGLVSAVS